MSSESAVYDIALETEANTHDADDVEITVMDDLEKGFEKVSISGWKNADLFRPLSSDNRPDSQGAQAKTKTDNV